jgi:hypothetical protein
MTHEQRVEESARAIEAAFYKAVDAGTNAEGFIPIATAALASSEKLIAELEARIARKDEALAAIFAVGDGWGTHSDEKPCGTTGEGHARCRELARAALNEDKPHD